MTFNGFSSSIDGYNKEEVNSFVDEVVNEFEEMLDKLKKQDAQISSLSLELDKYKEVEVSLSDVVLFKENLAKESPNNDIEEANKIIEDAKRNASRIVNDALIKADKVEQDVENLKKQVKVFKRRLKAVVDEQVEYIDSIKEDY